MTKNLTDNLMKLTTLGASREVGRSAFLLEIENKKIILDYGVQIRHPMAWPLHVNPKEIDAIILSHAHLDHSGGVPSFYLSNDIKTYCTKPTAQICDLLIDDFINLSNDVTKQYIPYQHQELEKMKENIVDIGMNSEFNIGDIKVNFVNAGHMPGSVSVSIEGEGKRVVYTGDINSSDQNLVKGADTKYGEVDLLITESTYGVNDHPDREDVEKEFVSFAKDVTERGGTLLVPAFAVGRSQEIACVLKSHNYSLPVTMDGMALKTNRILLENLEFLGDSELFKRMINGLTEAKNWKQRKELMNTPGVIIVPAGMMVGGLSSYYKGSIAMNEKNAISLVSYQAEGTPGRTLLEKKMIKVDGKLKKIKGKFEHFNFSSHSGSKQLFEMIDGIKGNPTIVAVHGEEEQATSFVQKVQKDYGYDAIAPELGDKIII